MTELTYSNFCQPPREKLSQVGKIYLCTHDNPRAELTL
jgi:hypothetical protein